MSKKKKMSAEKMAAKKEKAAQEKRDRQKRNIVICAAIAVLLVIAIVIAVVVSGGEEEVDPTFTSSTVSETETSSAVESEVSEVSETESAVSDTGDDTTTEPAEFAATHYADIDIADYGTITIALDGNTAPATVENFVTLAQDGFYDGLTFHRIMEGFMMQGGDPDGNGTGGSDTEIVGEFSANGHDNPLSHTRGAVSMARSSAYDSASSQFFIVHQDSTFLDGQYAAFGYVTEGMDVVDAVCEAAEPTDDNGTIPAEAQPVINSVTVREA